MSDNKSTTLQVQGTLTGNQKRKGKCQLSSCKKETSKTCPRCNSVFYCKSGHRNDDWPRHKAECQAKSTPTIELEDFLQVATETCFAKFLVPEKNVGFVGNIPMAIKNIDNRKHYLIVEKPGMDIDASRMVWYEKGFTQDDFWSVFCLGKGTIFHYAIVSAMRTLMNDHKYVITYGGKPIVIFGTQLVKVVKPFDIIVPTYDWSSKDEDQWKRVLIHDNMHEVIWFSLGQGERYLIDLCGPCYGISSYNDDNKPLWVSHYDKQNFYATMKLAFPDEIDKTITNKLIEAKDLLEKSGQIDWKPVMCLNAKELIVKGCLNLGL